MFKPMMREDHAKGGIARLAAVPNMPAVPLQNMASGTPTPRFNGFFPPKSTIQSASEEAPLFQPLVYASTSELDQLSSPSAEANSKAAPKTHVPFYGSATNNQGKRPAPAEMHFSQFNNQAQRQKQTHDGQVFRQEQNVARNQQGRASAPSPFKPLTPISQEKSAPLFASAPAVSPVSSSLNAIKVKQEGQQGQAAMVEDYDEVNDETVALFDAVEQEEEQQQGWQTQGSASPTMNGEANTQSHSNESQVKTIKKEQECDEEEEDTSQVQEPSTNEAAISFGNRLSRQMEYMLQMQEGLLCLQKELCGELKKNFPH